MGKKRRKDDGSRGVPRPPEECLCVVDKDDILLERLGPLTQGILNGFRGGQVVMRHYRKHDTIIGRIEKITLDDGILYIICDWVYTSKPGQKKWIPRDDGTLCFEIKYGWKQLEDDRVCIRGATSVLVLYPEEHLPLIKEKDKMAM